MRSLSSYLLLMFMIMFWLFRIVVAFTATMGMNFAFKPLEMNMEIILLFVTLLSILLVGKRKLIGAILYLISYGLYFGIDFYNIIMGIINETGDLIIYTNALTSFIGIALPVAVLFNLLFDKARTAHPVDKKTDWFYKGNEYDRKIDERADQNQYRNY